ncbi:ribose-5-phosphate isomerase [Streptomyces arenae]|uniref:ribose-5-phosphate isomerase n=1 Tax=Streptomyces arenae TaxID=29301 RepID=UPI00265972D6|nr:ribose-5-phosphate isomerase [Streptomyces arenae]MCG7202262.1 ribose-5-phosphate isomerase [Streptomyces arenae]
MRVYLGSDHAGYELKTVLVTRLPEWGYVPVDVGPHSYDGGDDYPPYILDTARRVAEDVGSLGVVIGGSGNGEAIAANKVGGVRAALAHNEDTARLGREHNDANVISVGARMHSIEEAVHLVEIFLKTSFSEDPRHVRRIAMIADYELHRSG